MSIEIRRANRGDASGVRAMFQRATPQSRYLRFFSHSDVGPELEVHRIEDGKPLVAMVAVDRDADTIVGLATLDLADEAGDIAVFVEDGYQHRGLGNRLSAAVVRASAAAGVDTVSARVLWENPASIHMMRRASPDARVEIDHGEYVFGPVRTLTPHGAIQADQTGATGRPGAAPAAA